MFGINFIKIRSFEKGLYFRGGEFKGILQPGRYWIVRWPGSARVDVVSQRNPWLVHPDLDVIVKSGALGADAVVLDLKDYERALVWIDGRFARVLPSGLYAIWTRFRDVKVETIRADKARFENPELPIILQSEAVEGVLSSSTVEEGHRGVLFVDGAYVETLEPGKYGFWKRGRNAKVYTVDIREKVVDVSGQEIMTADKVTLRLNAVAAYRVTDPVKAVMATDDLRQALYRETQLALRAAVGTRELDVLLSDKDVVTEELLTVIRRRSAEFGVEVITLGIRDLILPGEMKELMNKVTEARKAAEANLITRREETAAMRSQANTARLLENNPALIRLRELEALEKIAVSSKLNVVLGEKGLADRVVNLL